MSHSPGQREEKRHNWVKLLGTHFMRADSAGSLPSLLPGTQMKKWRWSNHLLGHKVIMTQRKEELQNFCSDILELRKWCQSLPSLDFSEGERCEVFNCL
jgi:hypothetical protein